MTSSCQGIQVSDEGKPSRPAEVVDVAARYLVYKLFDAISGTPETSRLLRDIDERVETLARAVERGWVVVLEHQRKRPPRCGLSRLLTKDVGWLAGAFIRLTAELRCSRTV